METHAESHKPEVLETRSFDAAGAEACLRETRGKSQAAWGPAGPCHTSCKRIRKYTLTGSAVNASKFTNNCLVRCIKRFRAKKSRVQAGEEDAAQGVRFMPAHAPVQNVLPCYKFGWSFPEAKSCWNIYQYAVTWQTPEGRAFYLEQRMIKVLGWHICDIWKVFCHSH